MENITDCFLGAAIITVLTLTWHLTKEAHYQRSYFNQDGQFTAEYRRTIFEGQGLNCMGVHFIQL